MKKRLRKKIAKEILGVKRLSLKDGDRLFISISDNVSDKDAHNMVKCLESLLKVDIVASHNIKGMFVIED